jgi:hypothetical protein
VAYCNAYLQTELIKIQEISMKIDVLIGVFVVVLRHSGGVVGQKCVTHMRLI